MDLLPEKEEQRFLIRSLRELVEAVGPEPLVANLLVEPDARFFPDRWEPSERGVRRIARRLFSFVDLEAIVVDVVWNDEATATRFESLEDGVCRISVGARSIQHDDVIIAALCLAVASAYRAHHRLTAADRRVEARLVDVTAVFLGFGVLTTNASHLYRASGEIRGSSVSRTVTSTALGALVPCAMGFLLAAQALARRADDREQRRIARLLEANQAAHFEAACAALAPAETLARRLALPGELPPRKQLETVLASIAMEVEAPEEAAAEAGPVVVPAAGVYILARPSSLPWMLLVIAIAMVLLITVGQARPGNLELIAFFAAPLVAHLVSRFARPARCSECRAPIGTKATECARCGGVVVGSRNRQGKLVEPELSEAAPASARAEIGGPYRGAPIHEVQRAPAGTDIEVEKLLADPKIAAALREKRELDFQRLLLEKRRKTSKIAVHLAIDHLRYDRRRHLDPRRRPPFGHVLGCGITLLQPADLDPDDGTCIVTACLSVFYLPLLPLGAYLVTRRGKGRPEIHGGVPLGAFSRFFRSVVSVALLGVVAWAGVWLYGMQRSKLQLINGLDVPVTVQLGGETISLAAGSRDVRELGRGPVHVVTRAGGKTVEELDLVLPGGVDFIAYDVLGAATILAEEIEFTSKIIDTSTLRATQYQGQSFVTLDDVGWIFVAVPREQSKRERHWGVQLVPGGWKATVRSLVDQGKIDAAAALATRVRKAEADLVDASTLMIEGLDPGM